MTKTNDEILFEKVHGSCEQIYDLYELLKLREHSISHNKLPSYKVHKQFVQNHPYRCWFIIRCPDAVVGSIYVQFNNSVGLNINTHDKNLVKTIIDFIRSEVQPMPAVASTVAPFLFVNVAHTNKKLRRLFDELLLEQIQVSFKI